MNSTYTINKKTLAIIPISERSSKIYEEDNIIIVPKNSQKLIEENCAYYGSSYNGRKKGTVDLIGVTHKSPIVIEETTGNRRNRLFCYSHYMDKLSLSWSLHGD